MTPSLHIILSIPTVFRLWMARLAGQVALRHQRAEDPAQDQEGAVAFDAAAVDAENAQALGCGQGGGGGHGKAEDFGPRGLDGRSQR